MKPIKTAILATALITFFCNVSYAAEGVTTEPTNWSYSNAEHWGTLDPKYKLCESGKEQSPINIKDAVPRSDNSLKFSYTPAPIRIIDDGLTTLNILGHKTIINDGHTIQLNFPLHSPKILLSFAGKKYRLVQFHFHFPSENLVDGKNYPGEIHFVNESKTGNILVIGVFITEGKANPAIQKILENLPAKENVLKVVNGSHLNLSDLMPTNETYYNFKGSLTSPPCTEGFDWIVMTNPIEASKEQIEQLKKAIGPANARPVQPTNNRVIYKVGG